MSLVISIFVGGGEMGGGGGAGFIEFLGVVKKRESPDFRSPEVGISGFTGTKSHDKVKWFIAM